MKTTALLLSALVLFTAGRGPAYAQAQPQAVITALPAGAIGIQSCSWKATKNSFDADIRLKNNTNLKVAKARFLLTFVNTYGETVRGYADMIGTTIALAPGMPLQGKWAHGVFPLSMKTIVCSLVGVKFQGYPNVIFSAVR